ncbi:hypothetical protein [Streptomyces cacaoi]|uniref:hypothetical protein n=1 Tax=Streptomyces cacaoi TaxID=1898 RepID=UPI0037480336
MPQTPPRAHRLPDKTALVRQLRELAEAPPLALRRNELLALADDLDQDGRLDRWAEVDLLNAFVRTESLAAKPAAPVRTGPLRALAALPAAVAREYRSGGVRGLLLWARDGLRERPVRDTFLEALLGMLVFVPLLITWFGLREAVRAYGELSVDDPKESTRPFLQLWQSGFGGHLAPLGRFENVALAAVLLIALLVVLSGWHTRVRARTERDEAEWHEEREHLLGRLAATLTPVQVLLAAHRGASPGQFGAELTKAARRMERLAAKADSSHHTLVTSLQAAHDATSALESAALRLTDEMPRLNAAADRIGDAVRDGQSAAARIGTESADTARAVADRIKAAGDAVESALTGLAAGQQALTEKSASVAEATERASQALVASTARTGEAIEGMRMATERWDAAAAHWQDAAQRLDNGLSTLRGSGADVHGRADGRAAVPYGGAGGYGDADGYGTPDGYGNAEGYGNTEGYGRASGYTDGPGYPDSTPGRTAAGYPGSAPGHTAAGYPGGTTTPNRPGNSGHSGSPGYAGSPGYSTGAGEGDAGGQGAAGQEAEGAGAAGAGVPPPRPRWSPGAGPQRRDGTEAGP